LVFATGTGNPFDPSDVSRRADAAWSKIEPGVDRFTLHPCRHAFAVVCIESGVNAKRLQRWMGHESITVTYDTYGRLLEGAEDDAVALVDAFLSRRSVGQSVGQSGAGSSGKERNALQIAQGAPPLAAAA
jgi:integrase